MFRIGLKFPCDGLNRIKKHGYSRLYLTARYYDTRAIIKCEPNERLYRNVRFMSNLAGREHPSSGRSGGARTLITLGAVTIGTLGILTYAKNEPEVRATLEGWIPGTDKAIRIIFQEESSYFDFILTFFASLKETILDMFIQKAPEPAPKPAFQPLVEQKKKAPVNENFTEIRVSKEKGEKVDVVDEKPAVPPPKKVPDQLKPQNLVELETSCGEAAAKAIAAYHKATSALEEYNRDVLRVVEGTGSAMSGAVWQKLKEVTEKRKETIQQAEERAKEALDSLKRMYNLIDDPLLEAAAHVKTAARRNVKKILEDVDKAKEKYHHVMQTGSVADNYWSKVKAARENFNEELQILFPSINIQEKKLSVNEDAFDLFVLHMYHKVNNLQKELEKLRTVHEAKIKSALRATGEDANEEKLQAMIGLAIDKEKLAFDEDHAKKLLAEQKKFEDEMRRQMKLQSEIHADHLREALSIKEQETQRVLQRALSEQVETDSIKHKKQLATVVGKLQALTAALKARMEEEKGVSNAQILWSACQALARAVKVGPQGITAEKIIRPLEPEINAVSKAAPKEDPLVCAAIRGIPEEAAKRGVFPEDALRERFLKVENVARRLAMVPAEGAPLPIYLLSYLQSFLIIKTANPIPKSELDDEPIDINSLNTYDILHRARYWLDRGDFKMVLRYMNLLKGAPRSIARDWMNEAKILLETQQAIDTLLAYAGATGLMYLGAGKSSKK